ncbi:helix-turn-helix domain-containing protein [bacterium]|nr:helix-turn-helix domain-containing protein [bacterium]
MQKRKPISGHVRYGRLLKRIRERAKMTQEDVAAQLDVRQTFVSKYESGDRRLDIDELSLICKAIGTDILKFAKLYVMNEGVAPVRERKPPRRAEKKGKERGD